MRKLHEDKIPHESLEEKLKVEMEVSLISIHNFPLVNIMHHNMSNTYS